MFEAVRNIFSAPNDHLIALKHGMMDAESRFLANQYTMKDFVEILEHRIRVGSAPMINQHKLAENYIRDFSVRNRVNASAFIQKIEMMENPKLPQFHGRLYFNQLFE
jgi:hypothetical protein